MELPIIITASTLASILAAYIVLKCRCALVPDVHKPNKPLIPKLGGLVVLAYVAVSFTLLSISRDLTNSMYYVVFYTTPIVLGVIGIVDDFTHVHEFLRVGASVLYPLIILLAMGGKLGYLNFPIIGHFSNPVVIIVLTIAVYGVFSNAINMMDVVNGVVPYSMILTSIIPLAYSIMTNNITLLQMTLTLLIPSIILFAFNKYPARLFNGNGGTYSIGALVAGLMLYSGLGTLILLVTVPYVINGLLIVVSSRGIKSREKLKPSTYMNDFIIYPNLDKGSTLTLMKMIVTDEPGDERKVIRGFYMVFNVATALTILLFIVLYIMGWV
ncbi:MraY family glycosyltransferase [Caldivirga maquilingensis]|uniref:Glycosyl transferase family 4 n=1 Tax=Caldivirga maquilingensis (strain ATCC 700844 / DSM 13496 / JCM 10307 / IC-167) TaxID=397948 RepID=A8MDF3_CALMQ|nr:glycosyltransferase 4 family protein [Caldivirga maquilingensis]ABW01809.1 glycosyl transferase family 4 [Caldivirga maquilingensis IC-167]